MERASTMISMLRWLLMLAGFTAFTALAQSQPQAQTQSQSQPPAQAQPQSGPQGQVMVSEETWIMLSEQPEMALTEARESLLRRDFKAAGEHMRAAAGFLETEAGRASGKTRQDLRAAADHLKSLADRSEREQLRGYHELTQAATEAHRALAEQYHQLAQRAHEARDDRRAGHYLRAAGRHLEHGLAWSGHMAERGTHATLDAVRTGAGALIAGTGWTAAKGGELFSGLGREIEKAGRWVEPRRGGQQAASEPEVEETEEAMIIEESPQPEDQPTG